MLTAAAEHGDPFAVTLHNEHPAIIRASRVSVVASCPMTAPVPLPVEYSNENPQQVGPALRDEGAQMMPHRMREVMFSAM